MELIDKIQEAIYHTRCYARDRVLHYIMLHPSKKQELYSEIERRSLCSTDESNVISHIAGIKLIWTYQIMIDDVIITTKTVN